MKIGGVEVRVGRDGARQCLEDWGEKENPGKEAERSSQGCERKTRRR